MSTRFFPLDRRDLQQYMVDNALANLFAISVKLKLFPGSSVDRYSLVGLSGRLFKLVKRRHTHLWDIKHKHTGL